MPRFASDVPEIVEEHHINAPVVARSALLKVPSEEKEETAAIVDSKNQN